MLEESLDDQQIIERVAALDIGKAELVCCVRLPGPAGSRRRVQEVVTYSTMTPSLQVMAERLLDLGVTQVVMEATSDYWKPPFYLLEAHGLETCWRCGWSTPRTSSTCPAGPRPTGWTRCGYAGSPNGR